MMVSDQLHALAPSSPGRGPQYPLNRKLGGPQKRYGMPFKKRKNYLAPVGKRK